MKLKIPQHLLEQEGQIQNLIIKALKNIDEYNLSKFKWVKEYQTALIKYVEEVFKSIGIGLCLKLNVNPNKLKKSIKIPIQDLKKAIAGETIEYPLLMKSLFDKLKEKFTVASRFFKKFGFNNGKPLQPINFKGKIIYNPETGKPLTEIEWKEITNNVTDFLEDKIGNLEEEMIVKAGLFGKLLQVMETDGVDMDKAKSMTYDEVDSGYDIVDTLQEAKEEYNLSSQEEYAIEYAKQHAAEYLSIADGSLKNKIVNMVRENITGGLEEGLSAAEMTQRLFWIDPRDVLGAQYKEDTIDAINRDWRRIAVTEMSYAMNNGYMAAVKEKNRKENKKTYVIFSGTISKVTCNKCKEFLGTILLVVDKPLPNDKIKDKHANKAIWIGKNNVGRDFNNWWPCFPLHPHCVHYPEEIDPEVEEWDDSINKIIWKT